ncbi:hypothetical protein Y032_0001g252 [Ancylostoma ceylanicum]|uniref:SWIM-type domain-containing protein n=1 Tax=Ancylostoma ceylanicum TaxID=53326 RepID=A0A016W4B4_9BILA|nr:hypothetical protein Y032_0001g252 [Ancylostoma ceylanicum]
MPEASIFWNDCTALESASATLSAIAAASRCRPADHCSIEGRTQEGCVWQGRNSVNNARNGGVLSCVLMAQMSAPLQVESELFYKMSSIISLGTIRGKLRGLPGSRMVTYRLPRKLRTVVRKHGPCPTCGGGEAERHRAWENSVRHERAVNEGEVEIREDGHYWIIESFRRGRDYRLEVMDCTCEDITMICPLCGVCPRCVSCSCPDGAKFGISCKHAHAFALYRKRNELDREGADENLPSPQTSAACTDVGGKVVGSKADDSDGSDVDSEQDLGVPRIYAEKRLVKTFEENMLMVMSFLLSRALTGTKDRLDEMERVNSLLMDIVSLTIGEDAVPRLVQQHRRSKRGQTVPAEEGNGPVNKMSKHTEEPGTQDSSKIDSGANVVVNN